jgi:Uma2 family endonuclease
MDTKKDQKDSNINEQVEAYQDQPPETPLIEERYEIINGVRYDLKPSPTFNHQLLITQIGNAIYGTCHPNGVVVVAPIDVQLDQDNTVQPDVIFISNESLHIIKNQRIIGAPDLLVEVLSPSTSKKDKIDKKQLYERFGVKEYWIVDSAHYLIEQYIVKGKQYEHHSTYGLDDFLESPLFSCISIDLTSLFSFIKSRNEQE